MKILVISDSHGRGEYLVRAISMHRDAEYVLFLGDGYSDYTEVASRFPDKIFYAVRGNNDWYCDEPYTRTLTLCNHKILMLHGHTEGVKFGLEQLCLRARAEGDEIVLFGHTHEPTEHTEFFGSSRIYFFNPGSCGYGGYRGNTYGILTIDESNILFSIGEIK
ncbi:MAG: YfcE family phosphodiesterase [Clostridia bacterium]|nr:YfcE family phosphodiesterase [Clostridia bacterium]